MGRKPTSRFHLQIHLHFGRKNTVGNADILRFPLIFYCLLVSDSITISPQKCWFSCAFSRKK